MRCQRRGHEACEGRTQTRRWPANAGSRLKLDAVLGRPRPKGQPSSRTGENSPYGMIGGIEETSASFEARSAHRSYPTNCRVWSWPLYDQMPDWPRDYVHSAFCRGTHKAERRGLTGRACHAPSQHRRLPCKVTSLPTPPLRGRAGSPKVRQSVKRFATRTFHRRMFDAVISCSGR